MNEILITRDSNDKIRTIDISCTWNDKLHEYVIDRKTSQLNGKITNQPIITIDKGKAGRSVTDQANLEYNSMIKKYLDKGYKNIKDFGYSSLSEIDSSILPKDTTDQNGFKKPMLAKEYYKVATSIFEKEHYASRKLDGVRCMIKNENNISKTSSRGGTNYDIAAKHILEDNVLNKIFNDSFIKNKCNDEFYLDGELYIHGKPLQYISGLCRKQTRDIKHDEIKYYIYDIAVNNLTFINRLEILNYIKETYITNNIVICDHVKTISWTEIKSLHDKWVNDGYEGCVIRDPNKEYGFDKRDRRMIKIKEFEDAEFEILGINEGLRDEDFSFLMKCDKGTFSAKPIGSREIKQEYRKNIENLKGKLATIKFFGYTVDGIPNLPVFKYVRYGDDIN